MTIMIRGLPNERLQVAGDIEAELRVPVGWADRRFRLATSDGTLILGTLSEGAYSFAIEAEGAGIVRLRHEHDEQCLCLEWTVEWITISDHDDGAVAIPPVNDLPLLSFM